MNLICWIRGHDPGWITARVPNPYANESLEWVCRRCRRSVGTAPTTFERNDVELVVEPREARTVELRRDLYEATARGMAEVVGDKDGEPVFALTDDGIDHVRRILDAALESGDLAPILLGDALDIPIPLAAEVLACRMKERNEAS